MSRDRRILIIVFVGLFLILTIKGGTWFFDNYEYKDVENTSSYSKEARANKFLAAEFYLRELGLDVESDGTRKQLLAPHSKNETILLNDYGPKLSPTRYAELKRWIESGGHLVIAANDYYYEPTNDEDETNIDNNQLLQEYGIQPQYTNFDEDTPYPDNEEISNYSLEDGTEITINFYPDYHLVNTKNLASFSLKDQFGIHLLQIEIGKGLLTVLSDVDPLSNYSIGDYDHAYLLWQLSTAKSSANSKIWLLYNNETDSIFTLLWKHARQACIAFIIFIAVALWTMQNRVGPVIPNVNTKSRNVIEHLRAIARFSWRQDHGRFLLHHSRLSCEQTLLSRYPVLKSMSTQERTEHIAEILDIPPVLVQKALYHEPKSTNEFINSSHQLQKLWILQ